MYSSGFDSFFFGGGFEIMFFLIFGLVVVVFVATFVRGVGQWHKNNNSPRLTVEAAVTAKRTDVSHRHDAGTHISHHTTWYYVTFEVQSGDRMELSVSGSEYGLLAEGDYGKLTFQGTRFLGFERE